MPIRRSADPINVKRVWDAIRHSSLHQQSVDAQRIIKYLQNFGNCTPPQAELYIKQTLKDGLILASNGRSIQNQKSLDQVQMFKMAQSELPELDGKDWYCFECHLAGDVSVCVNCFRVFHIDCIPASKRRFEQQKKTILNQNRQTIQPQEEPKEFVEENVATNEENILENESKEGTSNISLNENDVTTTNNAYNTIKNYIYDETLCCICNIANIDTEYDLDKSEMNYLLKFVLHRIRSWLPTTITNTMAQEDRPEWLTDTELTWRANHLFFEHKDMSVIEVNLNNEFYSQLCEFFADVLTVQHNVAIFHGIESQEYGAAELMVRDTIHDITELRNCSDCYRHSNEKINNRWYCLPCRVPHELVWAKQKGYPYWPAKVIKKTSTHYDVRFFGGKYERALLVKSLVKPITMTKESLHIKSTAAFNKAYEELQLHQKLLQDPVELEKLLASSKQRKRSLTKPKPLQVRTKTVQKTPKTKPSTHIDVESTEFGGKRKLSYRSFKEAMEKKKKLSANSSESHRVSGNIIDISDGDEIDDDGGPCSSKDNNFPDDIYSFDESYEQVTSSTENFRGSGMISPRRENGMQQLDHPYSDSVEKMRRKLESLTNKNEIIKCAMDCMQAEVDRITNDNNDNLKRLFESHNAQISETKKKQWCYNCEQDAIYHCCWNTAYCSQTCQQQHWQAEHKKVCRRKR